MLGITIWLSLWCAAVQAILPLPYSEESDSPPLVANLEIRRDPKSIRIYSDLLNAGKTRELELPNFTNGEDTLGYAGSETFRVPDGLRSRVNFWKKIYTEFDTSQGVLHDAEYPDIIYSVINIKDIDDNRTLSPRKKRSLIQRRVQTAKKDIEDKLRRLGELTRRQSEVPIEMFSIFKQFAKVPGEGRFEEAIDRIRMQLGQRDRIAQGFLYGGRYFDDLMRIFAKKKVPQELTRLPLVESAFNLAARSKVGASGVWQFMRSTGSRFLRIDRSVDERNDPISAAWAAAELLRRNYEALGSWPLAITAYNHGREGVLRAISSVGSNDLSEIIRRYKGNSFGFASSNFYSEFLAILEVESEYRTHFGRLLVDAPLRYEEFTVKDNVYLGELADACRIEESTLVYYNPAFTDWVLSGKGFVPGSYTIKVPQGARAQCSSGYRNVTKASTLQ